jgi:hypothetical protein
MKKYMQPEVAIIDMETITVVACSPSDGSTVDFQGSESETMDLSRNRGAAWSDYEDL